jgi:hypothetical protein
VTGAPQEVLAVVTQRLRVYALTVAVLSALFFPLLALADLLSEGELRRVAPGPFDIFHVLGTSMGVVIFLALGRVQLSRRALTVTDFALSLWFCAAWTGMTFSASSEATVGYFSLLAYSNTLVARAGLVVSHYRRTLAVTAACGVVILSGGLYFHIRQGMPTAELTAVGILYATWTFTTVCVATVVSVVIFGLRREAERARQLGQYRLEEKIGEGGMGRVYRARHALLRRPTAVKLLSAGAVSEQQRKRFGREAQATSMLSHPNTIALYDFGVTPLGEFYYAMEYVDGPTLQQLVEWFGPMDAGRAVHVTAGVAGALGEAHAVGLLHRDVKPANVLVVNTPGAHDKPKLCDFGLVKEIDGAAASETQEASLTGTPEYMAPESIQNQRADPRSDIYALGAVVYFLVCGRPVFTGHSTVEVCAKHLREKPTPPSRYLLVPQDLESLILACLEKNPTDRPVDAGELQHRLLDCEAAQSWSPSHALAWWQEHGVAVRRKLELGRALLSRSHDTLLVDLDGRPGAHGTPPTPNLEAPTTRLS